MKIYDCFMYSDEKMILDIRMNVMNEYVDHFVIVESKYKHNGDIKNKNFDIEQFSKFKNKIIYKVYDEIPNNIDEINDNDDESTKSGKYIMNAVYRENGQRNFIMSGLKEANDEDIILISDVDEIPNLSEIKIKSIKEKIILFKQDMFYYKFNLKLPDIEWTGTKACKKKNLLNPQWLRNIKDRKYPIYRIDVLFSEKKYIDVKIINNGGWHFSNIKSPDKIEHKLKSYLHHREFDLVPLNVNEIKKIMENKQAIYDLSVDKTVNKIGIGSKLEKYDLKKLPEVITINLEKYKEWLD